MDNYKVKVKNKVESKEAQELFFELGYDFYFGGKLYCNTHLDIVAANKDGLMANIELDGFEYKELTIQQLRDMVVLKRNDVGDATHINFRTNTPFLVQGSKEYFYLNNKWILSDSVNDLKPIKEKEMQEFLVKQGDKWTFQLLDSDTEENSYRVAVPEGMNIYWEEGGEYWFSTKVMGYRSASIIWKRPETESLNDQYAEIEKVRQETVKVTIDELKHRVYKKDVSHLDSIDVYRVLELFNVQSHAVGHAIKKLLCSGGRGAKDEAQDIQEAIDSLVRYQEMKNEDD